MIKSFKELIKEIEKFNDKVIFSYDEVAKKAAYFALRQIQLNLTDNKSVDTGFLRKSFRAERVKMGKWAVGSNVKYMWYVEYGTHPHTPPLRPLAEYIARKNKWYGKKGVSRAEPLAWAMQKSIELRGTKPHPYIRPALDKTNKELRNIARKVLREILGR